MIDPTKVVKVASTDQLGRLIVLAGSAIDLAREGNRSAEQTDALLDALQKFKDPNRTLKPTIGYCGYPHYDDPKRPNFGPHQVRYLCQFYPGLMILKHNARYGILGEYEVVSYPYKKGGKYRAERVSIDHDWWIDIKYTSGVARGIKSETSLSDGNIVGGVSGTFYGPGWNPTNWISFKDQPRYCHHNHHSPCHH